MKERGSPSLKVEISAPKVAFAQNVFASKSAIQVDRSTP